MLAANVAEPSPDVAAIVEGRCPPGTGWGGRRCEVGSAPVVAMQQPDAQTAARKVDTVEAVVDETFQSEAARLCTDEDRPGAWWFCTRAAGRTENAFILAYKKETTADDLGALIETTPDVTAPLFAGLGGGSLALGAGRLGILYATGAFEPGADTSSSAPMIGLTAAMAILGGVFCVAGVALMMSTSVEDLARTDQEIDAHQMSKPQALKAVERYNGALYKRLRADAALAWAEPPRVDLVTLAQSPPKAAAPVGPVERSSIFRFGSD